MARVERVSQILKEEISNILHDEIKDPRLGFITVTRVELTNDLRQAKVFFSVLGSETEQKDTKQALESSGGFIRRLIAQRLNLRFTPEIVFKLDRSAEYSIQIQEALNKIKELDNESGKGRSMHKRK
ncbi:MAG: 30S ribosome-binding factor RbfA [Candidatus Omnitrophica bacterium]|nr:30S ribosome-binding factor RbfA [Candidatus Omnitrophota bacterium]